MSENMIAQSYVGQISVLGECFCYGAAIDDQQLVYLDIAGSATSVEAVWAKLAQAKECFIIPPQPNAPKIVLRSDKEKLKRFERKVEGVGILFGGCRLDPDLEKRHRGRVKRGTLLLFQY